MNSMAETTGASAASQAVASFQHERILLRKQLTEVQVENAVLRQQLYQVSSLLDIAVNKLDAMGISLETPLDTRVLRAEALRRAHAERTQATYDAAETSPKLGDPSSSQNSKRFQLRQQLTGHSKAVQCCSFADTEEPRIVTGGMDCQLIVYNYFSGEKLWSAAAHEESVSDVAWFEDHCILSASYDNTVKLWDLNGTESSKDAVYQYNAHGFVLSAIPLGQSMFACADARRKTAIVDVRFGGKGVVHEHENRVNSLSYDASSHQLLMGQSNGVVSIWDMRKPDQALSSAVHRSTSGGSAPTRTETSGPNLGSTVTARDGSADAVPGVSPGKQAALGVSSGGGGGSGGSGGGSLRLTRTAGLENDPSHSPISYVAHYHSEDDTRRLICVSGDNMVRLYRGNINAFTAGRTEGANLYVLRNVLAGVPTRGNVMRSDFWKGERGKSEVSAFFDDGEKDVEAPGPRRLTECDLLVTGGPDNTVLVFDVSDDGSATVLEKLEGHRDRVTGAVVRRSKRPIIASTSADSTVRIWAPVKS